MPKSPLSRKGKLYLGKLTNDARDVSNRVGGHDRADKAVLA